MNAPDLSSPTVTTRARLRQLLAHWSAAGIDTSSIDAKKPPELVLVRGDQLETWKLLRREQSGPESVYELRDRRPPKNGAAP